MKRKHLHLSVDAAMGLLGLGVLTTGLLLVFVLPPGSGRAAVAGWTRHAWGDLHLWLALSLVGLAAVHVTLNWNWVCNVVSRLVGKEPATRWGRRLAGLIAVALVAAVITALLLTASALKIEHAPPGRGSGSGHGHHHTASP